MKVKPTSAAARPPIVAVLGHVDHGKTTLLDTIRKSDVAAGEVGSITQKIGAYQITTPTKPPRRITFLDTPGHEAFANIRSRGAMVADIAVLVVAADDGVNVQTEESIAHIKQAGIPLVVAINKIDLPNINTQKVKQQLASHGVQVESLGGDVVAVELSAKNGTNIEQLLEVILLLADLNELSADSAAATRAIVIETHKDKRGVVATVIVQQGTLHVGDVVFAGAQKVRVRALFDEHNTPRDTATPATPVALLGFKELPDVGSTITAGKPQTHTQQPQQQKTSASLEEMLLEQAADKQLEILLRADTAGSLEAIQAHIPDGVQIVHAAVGDITQSDILMAAESTLLVLGFNVPIRGSIKKLAEQENVQVKTYTVIYELLDEIAEVAQIIKNPHLQEEIVGRADILAEFPFSNTRVAGCRVGEGRMVVGDTVRVTRDDHVIGQAKIRSIRQGKQTVNKVASNAECGVVLDKKLDFQIKDSIIAYKNKRLL